MLTGMWHLYTKDEFSLVASKSSSGLGVLLLAFVSLYMGTRPISGAAFGDMWTYADTFKKIQAGNIPIVTRDYLFNYFMIFCTKIMSVRTFFFVCTVIYTLPCYLFSKKYFGSFWFFGFFLFVGSLMFWGYGTNGIRNGMATSIFILAICFYDKKLLLYSIMGLSYFIHSSLIIPIAGFAAAGLYKNPKIYLYIWLVAIPLSLAGGSSWEGFFGGLGFGDDTRAEDYLTKGNINNDTFAYTGFRWDFVLYSSFAVFSGWYYIFKKKVIERFYVHLWCTFMVANSFWILIIRANFSNRFAYLSWFLMAPIIAYPLLKYKIFPNQYRIIGGVVALYYLFTYLTFLKG